MSSMLQNRFESLRNLVQFRRGYQLRENLAKEARQLLQNTHLDQTLLRSMTSIWPNCVPTEQQRKLFLSKWLTMAHRKRIPVLFDKAQLVLEIIHVKLQISGVAMAKELNPACPRQGFQSTQSLGKAGARYQPAFS